MSNNLHEELIVTYVNELVGRCVSEIKTLIVKIMRHQRLWVPLVVAFVTLLVLVIVPLSFNKKAR
jgi:phage-related protein